jgi:ABC-type nitrate/sulfonate/bicarbonate transport system permease component
MTGAGAGPAPTPATAAASTRPRRSYKRELRGILGLVLVLLLWQAASWRHWINPIFVGDPIGIVKALYTLFADGTLPRNISQSAKEFGYGFLIGSGAAMVLGVVIGWFSFLDDLTEPLVAAAYATPYVAFLPIIIIWAGIGVWSKVVIVIWASFFSVLINTQAGVKNTSPELIRVAEAFCVSRARMLWTLALPAAVPFILAGLRQSIGRSLVAVIVAEFYLGNNAGLGSFILLQSNLYNANNAFAAIILFCIAGIVLVRSVAFVERRVAHGRGIPIR